MAELATEAIATPPPQAPAPRPWTVLSSSPFRKLWAATGLSLFGDMFSYVATAWLVLQLTGSSLALGTVLVVQALPRAILMVVGGALADRVSPRLTMLGSMGLRAVMVGLLAALILSNRVQMWQVYGIEVVFGVIDAFFMPARSSILPRVVSDRELEPGNAVLNVTGQMAIIFGPILGGLAVAQFGTGWAFAFDAACFAIGFVFILAMPTAAGVKQAGEHRDAGLGGQILAGFRYAWNDIGIRITLLVVAVIDFAANGALGVGLPTLVRGQFHSDASGLGILFGAWGVGATLGALGAGFVPPPKKFGWLIVALCLWFGAGTASVGLLPALIPAAIVMAISGLGTGVINTYGISWLQRRTRPEMQGRVMSLVMLASLGLTPVSFAVSGVLAELNATLLFLIAGGMSVLAGVVAASSRSVRELR